MRGWEIAVYLVGPEGDEIPATCYTRATYLLHESFGKRQRQVVNQPPFKIEETGWGEFDMQITLTPVGSPKGGDHVLNHDLNFAQERYEATHNVVCMDGRRNSLSWTVVGSTCRATDPFVPQTFRNPKPELLQALKESGPAGDATNGATAQPKKRKQQSRNVDMEKLADALPQLSEDDLLQVVQMVHDNKTEDTYTKNDLESGFRACHSACGNGMLILHPDGEFHVDLYTLPDNLIKMLWDYTSQRVDMNTLS